MSTQKRRQYTEEFKTEAVRLVQDSGKPEAAVARELGIADNVLYRWRTEEQEARRLGTTRSARRGEHEELTRLKRELDTVRKERDFLKRAAAFFAAERS